MNEVNALLQPGTTTAGTRIPLTSLGQKVSYPHRLTRDGALLSGRSGVAVLVINDSGSTLLPGRGIQWKDGYHGTKIGGYSGAGERCDGIIDHQIPAAGVATGDAVLVIVTDGRPGTPAYVWTDGANALAHGYVLKTAANGYFTKDASAPAAGDAGQCEDTTIAATLDLRFWMEFRGSNI